MGDRYWWQDEHDRPLRAIDSRSHEGIAYMNWCLRQKPAEPQLNAVERLLARAEEVVGLFEAMFGRLASEANPHEAESLSKLVATYAFANVFAPNEREDGPLRYREVLTNERLGLMKRWESDGALHLAVERTIAENGNKGKRHGHGHDLSAEAIAAYCDILAAREAMLDKGQWLALVQNVIQESGDWGLHAGRIGELATAVRLAVQPLWELAPKPEARRMTARESREGWQALKTPLRAAIDALIPYAKPPRAMAHSGVPNPTPAEAPPAESSPSSEKGVPVAGKPVRRKRYTPKGTARPLLVARLNAHHKYDHEEGLNLEPIGSNKLAELVGVNQSTSSAFFKAEFGGYEQYCRTCADPAALAAALRLLNGDVKPHHLYGRAPPGEGARADEA